MTVDKKLHILYAVIAISFVAKIIIHDIGDMRRKDKEEIIVQHCRDTTIVYPDWKINSDSGKWVIVYLKAKKHTPRKVRLGKKITDIKPSPLNLNWVVSKVSDSDSINHMLMCLDTMAVIGPTGIKLGAVNQNGKYWNGREWLNIMPPTDTIKINNH